MVEYNGENRPIKFTNVSDSTFITMRYDYMGRRAGKLYFNSQGVWTSTAKFFYKDYSISSFTENGSLLHINRLINDGVLSYAFWAETEYKEILRHKKIINAICDSKYLKTVKRTGDFVKTTEPATGCCKLTGDTYEYLNNLQALHQDSERNYKMHLIKYSN